MYIQGRIIRIYTNYFNSYFILEDNTVVVTGLKYLGFCNVPEVVQGRVKMISE